MRNAQSTLAVSTRTDGATTYVHLDGELDIASSPLLQAVVDQALAGRRLPPCQRLVVNMSGVGFADASGISPLPHARATLARRGGTVEIRHPRRGVRRLLRLLGLSEMVEGGGVG